MLFLKEKKSKTINFAKSFLRLTLRVAHPEQGDSAPCGERAVVQAAAVLRLCRRQGESVLKASSTVLTGCPSV